MSFSGVTKNSQNPIDHLLPLSEELSLWKAVEIFKKYREFLNRDYLFIFNESADSIFIYFIHKDSFFKSIDDNIDVFLKELGNDFTPESFLSEILEEKRTFLEIIHYHEGILGILLGYGRHNSLLFQKKADILGRCWGYGQKIKPSCAKEMISPTIVSIDAELTYLNKKLSGFSEEREYCELIPIAPLGFAADNDHLETKDLKNKYRSTRKIINETYTKSNPIELILNTLFK